MNKIFKLHFSSSTQEVVSLEIFQKAHVSQYDFKQIHKQMYRNKVIKLK